MLSTLRKAAVRYKRKIEKANVNYRTTTKKAQHYKNNNSTALSKKIAHMQHVRSNVSNALSGE